jgi:PAS domain S-box-containing protein
MVQPVWVVDQAGLIQFANPSALAALGYDDAAGVLGKPAHQTVHYKRPDGTAFPVEECLMPLPRAGETVHAEDWLVRQDGSVFPVEYWSAPIGMSSGHGAVVAFTDVSERLAAERAARERDVAEGRATELIASEARQRTVLQAALDGVISIDRQARITYANTAAERIFGYRAGEMIGRELAGAIVPPSLREAHLDGFARYLTTGAPHILDRRIEINAMRADGSEFPAELTITRTDLPGAMSFTGYIRDITDRQRAEQELMASRARLVTASDAARQQVTRDLHDGAQQHFVSAVISLQLAQQKWASDPQRARELLDLALGDAKLGIDGLREIAAGIHPTVLTQRGLATALSALTSRLPIPVQLHLPVGRLPGPIESSLYFFCSEALTNVVKHAHASSAWIRVTAAENQCTAEVSDDGIGGARARHDGSGLIGLRDRIGALNGVMDITSPAQGGTILRARIPLPAERPGGPDSTAGTQDHVSEAPAGGMASPEPGA